MFKLVIQDDEGKTTVVPLIRDEITIGRKEGNTIRLTERNVSRRHARILRNNGEVQIEDLGSYNGIRVNNARIAERVSLRVSDQVQIGDYKLYLKAEGAEQVDDARTTPMERVEADAALSAMAAGTQPPAAPNAPASNAPTTPIQVLSATSAMVGSPNRTMVAMGDAADVRAAIGPATQAAVAALHEPAGYGRLVVLSSNFAGKEFQLSRPQMIIGRTDENDIVVNHRSISRNHAKIVREPDTGRYTVSDLQSSNGVRVNGQDYGKVELRRGDVVDLGHVRLRFVEPGEDFLFSRDAVITDVPDSGGKRGTLIAIALGILVLGGIGIYFATRGSGSGNDKPPVNKGSGEVVTNNGGTGSNGSAAVAVTPGSNSEVTPPNNGSNGETPPGPGSNANGSNGSDTMVAPPATIDAGAAVTPNTGGDDLAKKRAECKQLQTDKKWQDLMNCAGDLAGLGDTTSSTDLKDHAVAEQRNDTLVGKLQTALSNKDYGEARKQLDKIDDDSVYKKDARSKYDQAMKSVVDDYRARAKGFAHAGKCKDVEALARQAVAVSPEAADAVRGVKCEAAADHPLPDHPEHPEHPVNPPPSTCDASALAQKGKDEINIGQYAAAVVSLEQSLRCSSDPSLYRLILLAACNSNNPQKAKQYFAKLPTSQQSAASQMCIRNKIPLP